MPIYKGVTRDSGSQRTRAAGWRTTNHDPRTTNCLQLAQMFMLCILLTHRIAPTAKIRSSQGRMGVAYVTGMQGNDPKYYLTIATPKHYDVHSGPEPTRHFADVDVSKHDEVDTYEPAFRAAIVEGKAGSIMCAYNAINGQPACANQYLLEDQLRGKWGFQGYVVSDCDAVRDVAANHRYRPTQAQGVAISVLRGMDNECVTFTSRFGEPVDKAYIDAVQQGYLPESDLDTALIRLFTARIKLGMFDPPDMVPYTKIDENELDSAEHRAEARKLANESMVLLKE